MRYALTLLVAVFITTGASFAADVDQAAVQACIADVESAAQDDTCASEDLGYGYKFVAVYHGDPDGKCDIFKSYPQYCRKTAIKQAKDKCECKWPSYKCRLIDVKKVY